MTLRLVDQEEPVPGDVDPARTLAEVSAVADQLRTFLAACRDRPTGMADLTAADIAQAKALLAESRKRLASATRRLSGQRTGRPG